MKRYTWILCDLDGTLLDFHYAESNALRQAADEFGIPLTPEALQSYEAINAALWSEFERGTITARGIRDMRFVQWLKSLGASQDAHAVSERFLELLVPHSVFLDGARELLERLHSMCQLALITNGFADVQRARVARFELDRWFDPILISEELGVSKPNSGIFDVAFREMGNPRKSEVLVLGDSLTSDIRGGKAFGIDTCWYNPSGRANDSNTAPTYEIRHLHEVVPLLGLEEA